MKAMKMGDLLEAMISKYGSSENKCEVKVIGLQRGENKHEKILADGLSSKDAEKFTIDEISELI